MAMKLLICIITLWYSLTAFGQPSDSLSDSTFSSEDIYTLLHKNPLQAYQEAQKLELEAQKNQTKELELIAINVKCLYYRVNNDFKNMLESAMRMEQKSVLYKLPLYQLIANRHLFEAYLFTGLDERAFQQLERGSKIMDQLDPSQPEHLKERANFLVAYSNYFLLKKDYSNQLKYIQLAGKEFEKLPEEEYTQNLLCIYYSNLAFSYNKNNIRDSAKYYAHLSHSLYQNGIQNELHFNNLIVLGDVAMSEESYEESLAYFYEAEKTKGYKNHLDLEELYNNIIQANHNIQNEKQAYVYQAKKDSLKLSISENQNKTLHKLLNEKESSDTNSYGVLILLGSGVVLIVMGWLIRRNIILMRQEKISARYLDNFPKNPSGDDISKLIELLKSNDPAFMAYFEEYFPGFGALLKNINPEITDSDVEFCALLKLKIPTKDIAKYTFRAPQTVRNKKYIIKNKLKIPRETDIYEWFDSL